MLHPTTSAAPASVALTESASLAGKSAGLVDAWLAMRHRLETDEFNQRKLEQTHWVKRHIAGFFGTEPGMMLFLVFLPLTLSIHALYRWVFKARVDTNRRRRRLEEPLVKNGLSRVVARQAAAAF
jgi:hypothetical protein